MLHRVLPTPSETSGVRNAGEGTMVTLTLLFFHSTNICLSFCIGLWVKSWDLKSLKIQSLSSRPSQSGVRDGQETGSRKEAP